MKTGKIQLIMGPMFSGKTTELIKRISRESMYRHKKTILIKYAKDQRYCIENVLTHDK
jgi:thymidine kinase